ncbi:MAG TPA: TonB-dependent receptor [Rhizomicrobium sp.]|nr:TonB-dependent receptor [Rhizomicrobium sp.]
MFQSHLDTRSLRSVLLLGAASVAAISLSSTASAQQAANQETVVVTGSRIPQQGLYAPSPVTAVGQQEMKFEGTTGVDKLLNNLPSVFADQTSGVSNGATGTATVNLRGLGSIRTLVLVNGTRLMPGDPIVPVADLNQVPSSLVDHVEVLTGGASAVYGSDALAGVVNFVMRKDFEGVELDAQYGIAQADNSNGFYRDIVAEAGFQQAKENIWDGNNDTATLIFGTTTANGRANVTAYVGYQNTRAVLAGARDFSACTVGGQPVHSCAGSSNFNRWISFDNLSAGTPYDFFQQGTGALGTGTFVPFTGANNQLFNFGALNFLQRPDTRYTGGFFAHYEVNKQLDVYSSFMFMDDQTHAQIAPSGLFLGTGLIGGSAISQGAFVQVNCANPLLTPSEAADLCSSNAMAALGTPCTPVGTTGNCNLTPGQALLQIGRRGIEAGDRVDNLHHTSYRIVVGARGDLGDGWTYDAYGQYGYTLFSENFQNDFSVSRVQNALEVDPATGNCFASEANANGITIDPTCVPLDIFNGIGSITPAMLNYVRASAFREGFTEEQILSASLTGDLGRWGMQSPWAKSPVYISVGAEYRAETLQDLVDFAYSSGDLYGLGGKRVSQPQSSFNVVEGFTELKIPIIQEHPWAEDLTFNAGYRYSSYSQSGGVSAYKYGFEYQPIDDFRIRAGYERAVRAPNILESFAPDNVVLFSGQDPCATSTAGQCASVPHAGTAALVCPANQCNQEVGGNPELHPEIGDTRTIGVVFTPTFVDGLTATIDYFNIDVSRAIGTIPPTFTLSQCYGPGVSAASIAFFCPLVHRNAAGQIFGGGFVASTNINTGFLHTKGTDFEANYNYNLDNWAMTSGYGALQFQFIGTWLNLYKINNVVGGPTYGCAGLFGLTCSSAVTVSGPLPRWRHRLRITWTTPWDVDFSFNWRFITGTKLDSNSQQAGLSNGSFNNADKSINDFFYIDLAADWNIRPGVDLHGGVNNLFDRLPPTLSLAALPAITGNNNTFPGVYDTMGRTLFIGATIKY